MVRAGEGGRLFDQFREQSLVAIGWAQLGDLGALRTREDFAQAVAEQFPGKKPGQLGADAGQTYRFVHEIAVGDRVLTYDSGERVYLVGDVIGGYEYRTEDDYPNVRRVHWLGEVQRDSLSVSARNSLGAISTLFRLPGEVASEITQHLSHKASSSVIDPIVVESAAQDVEDLYRDVRARGLEFIKDKVNALDWQEMQEVVAGLLRAMGYKTRVSPSGSDRGKDIVASRDGFGFEDPRIVVEVKHRNTAMGAPQIRGFLGGRHERDRGLYVSTGGFTQEARYEAERARIPLTLMDLDDLVNALLDHYEAMDIEMRQLIPLRKIYWPG